MAKPIWSRQMEYARMRENRVRRAGTPGSGGTRGALPWKIETPIATPVIRGSTKIGMGHRDPPLKTEHQVEIEQLIDGNMKRSTVFRMSRKGAEKELGLWKRLKGYFMGKVV